ncbi:MAG: hypothetical protein HGB15_09415 [Chlorobaculum sp.]|nr:hypothetical protein [Chlorobaculum sp.]
MNQRIVHHETFCAIQHSMQKFCRKERSQNLSETEFFETLDSEPGSPVTKSVRPVNAVCFSSVSNVHRYNGKEQKKSKPFIDENRLASI